LLTCKTLQLMVEATMTIMPRCTPATGGYSNSHHPTHAGYYTPQQQTSYGPVYYPVSHGGEVGQHAAFDSRKRNYDALNDFFGDLKRNRIDASSYQQVGQRLVALQGIPIHGGAISTDYMQAPALVSVDGHGHGGGGGGGGGGHHGHMPQHQYALPLPNLRTKNDLMNIDQFLEQMQSTVYESSNAAAAAGIQQPGSHYTHSAINFRQSHSPPQTAINNLSHLNNHVSGAPMMATHSSQSTSSGTPALTPPSSSVSYTSGHSPVSSHGMSPTSRHSSTVSAAYPSLPSVSMGYSPQSTTAPTSTLGTNFDSDPRRRYSGGMLQRSANPPRSVDMMDVSDDSTPSPKQSIPQLLTIKSDVSSNIDPALSNVSSPGVHSESGDSARDRAEEAWIENIRVIEALRKFISDKLERKEYEDDDDVSMGGTVEKSVAEKSSENLYPVLRADDD
jgi:hypothetical protein